jgi:von Willebrand factor type A domain
MGALSEITFLTPLGALVALAAVLPIAAMIVARRRLVRACTAVRLRPPLLVDGVVTAVALSSCVLLLAVAAAQPVVLADNGTLRVRTDAEAMFVFDVSRSMLARQAPTASTRLERGKAAALKLRQDLANVPAGVATLSDRVIPDLFPVPDEPTFDATVQKVVDILQVPPLQPAPNVTNLASVTSIATQGFFTPGIRHRFLVLITDGEGQFDPESLAGTLNKAKVELITIRVWGANERVYGQNGRPELYRPDSRGPQLLASLAMALGTPTVTDHGLNAAVRAIRATLGKQPVEKEGRKLHKRSLAPFLALCALLPLGIVLWRRNAVSAPWRRPLEL